MSFPRYPKYKDSGVEWLGEVPEHWEICALKRIAAMRSGDAITAESIHETGEYPVYGGNGLRGYTAQFTHEGNYALIGRQGALCGNINYASGKFWASEHAVVVSPVKQVDTLWLGEMLRAMNLNQYSVSAAQPGLSVDLVIRLRTALPPLPEQRYIAAFLDRETAKIDALVAEQQRLIELLKEKRQAVISHAVTRGLNPDVPLKPSGVEWLGDVPAHWKVGNLRRFAEMKTGHTPSRSEATYWIDCDIPWFTLADVWQLRDETQIYLGDTKERISRVGLAHSAAEILPAGTVVFSRTASVGFSGIMPVPMATSQDFWNWIPGSKLKSEYLLYQFRAMKQELKRLTMGSTHKTIYQGDAASLCAIVPPTTEQGVIVDFLYRETAKIDELVGRAQRAVDLLQERRTALISAAVTGQIDVRGLVQPERI